MSVTVTYLEMHSPAELRPKLSADPAFRVEEARIRQWQVNKFFYHFVGASWDWWEKLAWTDDQWRAYAEDTRLRTWIATYQGSPAGYFELRADAEGGVELVYFGLAPTFIGRGLGGALLTLALREAWAMQPGRVWVHTCTLDHPAALENYKARGMKPYQTRVEPSPPALDGTIGRS